MSEKIEVALIFNDAYAEHAAVVIRSMIANCGEHDSFIFHLINTGLNEKSTNLLKDSVRAKDLVNFIEVGEELIRKVKLDSKYNKIVLYRLALPTLLKSSKKVLYLDCDVVVNDSLRELWNLNLENSYAAVVDEGKFNPKAYDYKRRIGMKIDAPYFNSGVMLINLEKWRSDNLEQKLFEYIVSCNHPLVLPDQDVLNKVLSGKITTIAEKWNFLVPEFLFLKKTSSNAPVIFHFATRTKPWQCKTKVFPECLYWKYRNGKGVNNLATNKLFSIKRNIRLLLRPMFTFFYSKIGYHLRRYIKLRK